MPSERDSTPGLPILKDRGPGLKDTLARMSTTNTPSSRSIYDRLKDGTFALRLNRERGPGQCA